MAGKYSMVVDAMAVEMRQAGCRFNHPTETPLRLNRSDGHHAQGDAT
jgi:hypothetical protein